MSTRRVPSPLGELFLVANTHGLVSVSLAARADPALADTPRSAHPLLAQAELELDEYFSGRRRVFSVPIDVVGTPFQQQVWTVLAAIPFGETRTYGQVASAIDRPLAVRAIGACNSRNPLLVVVPCHRVLGASGALVGWSGGVDGKRWLLDHERRISAGG